ncbi:MULTISPECIES: diacylglycerol kinase [unclassified Nitratiruptor]|uniref:diacylglycerol kinase n=1 Tax=unclassified Nitratiruptor TaxID=2624044 RepID=UPI0019163832|nr:MULTISPECIES: diacylglycerol kinase [unclassified Nitratiruptor]BCD59469.1 diacylglycerol kinase (ATP) [Nitratiruptor sp. YY08-10]BCD63393.1 diacylglycerol kinase (ATP) [Nitratiruptor sp. YY08-14]
MRNQPKYHLFKNARYALDGLIECWRSETSFKIEVILFILFSILFWLLPIALLSKVILQTSLFVPLIAELLNSAIERIVDLASPNYHPLAKAAKDAGAAAVLLSLFLTVGIWVAVAIFELF